MTPTALLDRPTGVAPSTKGAVRSKASESSGQTELLRETLGDETVPPSNEVRHWSEVQEKNRLGEATSAAPAQSRALAGALGALREVLGADPEPGLWQSAAQQLRAAMVQEAHRSRRHAAMALILSRALSYTDPRDLSDPEGARRALEAGWSALAQPFVPSEDEVDVTRALVATGWQLTLPYRGWAASA